MFPVACCASSALTSASTTGKALVAQLLGILLRRSAHQHPPRIHPAAEDPRLTLTTASLSALSFALKDAACRAFWSGAIAGGLVGSLAGFLANIIRSRLEFRCHRQSVASALVGELEALREHVTDHYLVRLKSIAGPSAQPFPYHLFRGERDYMPIFRSLGESIGYLPSPLPRDLAFWYTGFAVCLERAHELNNLARQNDPGCLQAALELAGLQRSELVELMDSGAVLLRRLAEQADKLTI